MIVQEHVSLKSINTFGMNVSARWYVAIQSKTDLQELFADKKIVANHFILGGGSNILFTKNINGFVVRNELKGIEVLKKMLITFM